MPSAWSMAATMAEAEPLPLVPPIWTSRIRLSDCRRRRAGPGSSPAPAACPPSPRLAARGAGPRLRDTSWSRLDGTRSEEGEDAAERLAQLAALDDHVELTVLEEELRALEAVGQRLPDRLRNHPRAREADEGAGL